MTLEDAPPKPEAVEDVDLEEEAPLLVLLPQIVLQEAIEIEEIIGDDVLGNLMNLFEDSPAVEINGSFGETGSYEVAAGGGVVVGVTQEDEAAIQRISDTFDVSRAMAEQSYLLNDRDEQRAAELVAFIFNN